MDTKLHYYQIELIRKLILKPKIRFNDLLIEGLGSEHMNYHLKKLVEMGMVIKHEGKYTLTDSGKDYSNLLDDEKWTLEKQPKTSIIIRGIRENKKGEIEYLLNKRLRHPYFGKVGRITGKVRFGETLEDAARRELFEETGLTAKHFKLEEIYRKMRKRTDRSWVQDVIFYIFFVTDFSGKLIRKTSFQENFWVSKSTLLKKKLDVYDDLDLNDNTKPQKLFITEHVGIAEGY